MKVMRFKHNNKVYWGSFHDEILYYLRGDIFSGGTESKRKVPFRDVKVLPPVLPSKIIAVGLNYLETAKSHCKEKNIKFEEFALPKEPQLFFKPPSSIIGHLDHIKYPEISTRVEYEGELGIVIGRIAKDISEKEAFDCIWGYTIVNDVSARDFPELPKSKSFDTFCPVGPVVCSDLDPHNLRLETRLNGKVVQSANTKDLLFRVDQVVSYISKFMTLFPGDLITTGTPAGVGSMKKGDVIEVEIEGIGILKNFVS